MARRPAVYAMMTALGARALSLLGGAEKLIHYLPLGGGWTAGRDFPAPQGKTFRELYRSKQ
jgi:L-lactate dehydrogenase complex protein LldF